MSVSQTFPLSWRLRLAPHLSGRDASRRHEPQGKLMVVAPPARLRGWILDAICREIVDCAPHGDAEMVVSDAQDFPVAGAYFFSQGWVLS